MRHGGLNLGVSIMASGSGGAPLSDATGCRGLCWRAGKSLCASGGKARHGESEGFDLLAALESRVREWWHSGCQFFKPIRNTRLKLAEVDNCTETTPSPDCVYAADHSAATHEMMSSGNHREKLSVNFWRVNRQTSDHVASST